MVGFETRSKYEPRFAAFNGKETARVFLELGLTQEVRIGMQSQRIGHTRVFVLPSTSGQAKRHWSEHPWHQLATLIRERA